MPPISKVFSSVLMNDTTFNMLNKRHFYRGLTFLLVLFFIVGKKTVVFTQDMRLAQFYKAPQLLNPALTGVFKGSFKFHLNYRDQWSSILGSNPFRTENIGVEFRKSSFGNDFFGLGVNAYLDGAANSHFQQTRAHLSGSYAKQISGDRYSPQSQYIILGSQFGFGQHTMNWNRLWFSDQYDELGGYPAYDTPSSEVFFNGPEGSTDLFLDINVGLLWYLTISESNSLYFGAALNHVNSPDISLLTDEEILDWRMVIHGGGEFPLTNGLSILPAFLFQSQGDRTSFSIGANLRYSNNDWKEMAFRIGAWPHFSSQVENELVLDEWTTSLILEWKKWDIGMSYGVNTSSLKNATLSRGAFEMSLTYVLTTQERFKLKCPKL